MVQISIWAVRNLSVGVDCAGIGITERRTKNLMIYNGVKRKNPSRRGERRHENNK
jgi:hypothetical protein